MNDARFVAKAAFTLLLRCFYVVRHAPASAAAEGGNEMDPWGP
jgi:hypothetical protein